MMKNLAILGLSVFTSFAGPAQLDPRVKAFEEYFSKYLVDNSFYSEAEQPGWSSKATVTYKNLSSNAIGITYEMHLSVVGRAYDVDADGKRIESSETNKDRLIVTHCEASVKESARKDPYLSGFCYNKSNSAFIPTGYAMGLRMILQGDTLMVHRDEIGFSDCFEGNDEYKPCSSSDTTVFKPETSDAGVVIRKTLTRDLTYNFDPDTYLRTSVSEDHVKSLKPEQLTEVGSKIVEEKK